MMPVRVRWRLLVPDYLMAVVAVSTALSFSAVKHRSAHSAQYCDWTWRCRASRCPSRVIGVIYPGTNTFAAVAAISAVSTSCRPGRPISTSTGRLVAVAAAPSAAAMAAAVAACSALSRCRRCLISPSGPVAMAAPAALRPFRVRHGDCLFLKNGRENAFSKLIFSLFCRWLFWPAGCLDCPSGNRKCRTTF